MSAFRGVSAILLDALGTLVALEPPAPRLGRELDQRFGLKLTASEAERAIAAEIAYYRANLDLGRDAAGVAELRGRCAQVLRGALPQSDVLGDASSAALTDALVAALHFSVYDDARAALGAARARGARLVVVSNWDASLHDVLARLGLTPLLDGVVTSAEFGARKPAPAIFAHALERAGGVAPARSIHVGDSLEEDVAGARAAGIAPVLLRRDGAGGPAGVRTISSLAELDHLGHEPP